MKATSRKRGSSAAISRSNSASTRPSTAAAAPSGRAPSAPAAVRCASSMTRTGPPGADVADDAVGIELHSAQLGLDHKGCAVKLLRRSEDGPDEAVRDHEVMAQGDAVHGFAPPLAAVWRGHSLRHKVCHSGTARRVGPGTHEHLPVLGSRTPVFMDSGFAGPRAGRRPDPPARTPE